MHTNKDGERNLLLSQFVSLCVGEELALLSIFPTWNHQKSRALNIIFQAHKTVKNVLGFRKEQ